MSTRITPGRIKAWMKSRRLTAFLSKRAGCWVNIGRRFLRWKGLITLRNLTRNNLWSHLKRLGDLREHRILAIQEGSEEEHGCKHPENPPFPRCTPQCG